MASGGVPRFVISRILNHSEEKNITSVYDRYGYDAEKRPPWNSGIDSCPRCSEGKSASSVAIQECDNHRCLAASNGYTIDRISISRAEEQMQSQSAQRLAVRPARRVVEALELKEATR